jgi:DNA polymerase-1
MHSVNAELSAWIRRDLLRRGVKETGRDIAKTWFYAFIYGAGDEKLGFILLRRKGYRGCKRGKQSGASRLPSQPAGAREARRAVKAKAKTRVPLRARQAGAQRALAARRSQHPPAGSRRGADEAALCILDDSLQEAGLIPGTHYEFVANVHDEWQIEVDHDKAEMVGQMAAEAIRKSGESFNFRCPLAGDFKVGRNWAETH